MDIKVKSSYFDMLVKLNLLKKYNFFQYDDNYFNIKIHKEKRLKELLKIFTYNNILFNSDQFIQKCVEKLMKNKVECSTAESITGGLIGHKFVRIPGVSTIYKGTIVAYQDNIKINKLNISKKILEKFSAVSYEVSKKMCQNVSNIFDSKLSISTSGYAGPKGKKIGLVYYSIKYNNKIYTFKKHLKGTRIEIIEGLVNYIFFSVYLLIIKDDKILPFEI